MDDDPVTEHTGNSRAQYPGWNQVQNSLLAADDQRVTSVMTALKTDDGLGLPGQQIDNLSLALVTPLGTDDDDTLAHRDCPD